MPREINLADLATWDQCACGAFWIPPCLPFVEARKIAAVYAALTDSVPLVVTGDAWQMTYLVYPDFNYVSAGNFCCHTPKKRE